MEGFIAFLDRNEWACWLGIVVGSTLVLAVDNSHFVPFS